MNPSDVAQSFQRRETGREIGEVAFAREEREVVLASSAHLQLGMSNGD